MYPNPVKDFIHVDYNKEFLLEIYNVQGEKVLMSKQTETNVSDLTSGTYFVLIKNRENKVITISQLVKE
ncbi:MAG: T9SS type A sorting domain-containing protein [Thermodesulfobacteriota bacterium]|nr:T9SS type A sorting domain-containing protein [Thermodesulfobacteriota bacterium]